MPVHVLLLKPQPSPLDEMPAKPFHCTVIAHYPVTGSYAHVFVVSVSSEDETANMQSFGSSLPPGFVMLNGSRHELEVLSLDAVERPPELGVSVADIGSG